MKVKIIVTLKSGVLDPQGKAIQQTLNSMGFGNVSPAVSYVLRPISYDITRAQAIETNDRIRKSQYSFQG